MAGKARRRREHGVAVREQRGWMGFLFPLYSAHFQGGSSLQRRLLDGSSSSQIDNEESAQPSPHWWGQPSRQSPGS